MPSPPRIYADFNAIEYAQDDPGSAVVAITGYGTLASLARQKLQLAEGMELVIYEPGDIECQGVAHFDTARTDPVGRQREWVVRIDPRKVHNCTELEAPSGSHPCFGCGIDLRPHLRAVGQSYTETCPSCGTSVMAPLAPAKSAA
jgi:hypothetical protein